MIARQKAQAGEAGGGKGSAWHTSTRTGSTNKGSKSKASTSKAAPDDIEEQGVDGGGCLGWIWDDLVEMDRFWPHPLLAVLETAGGTAAMLFFQSTSGGPLFRCVLAHKLHTELNVTR